MVINKSYTLEGSVFTIFDQMGAVLYTDTKFYPPEVHEVVQIKKKRSGAAVIRSFYANDLLHGPTVTFFANGVMAGCTLFVRGKREGAAYCWDQKGLLRASQWYQNNRLQGLVHYFDEEGRKWGELTYRDGLLDGKASFYFEDGKLKREMHYKEGKLHGYDTMWDSMEIMLFSIEYDNGMRIKVVEEDPVSKRYHI